MQTKTCGDQSECGISEPQPISNFQWAKLGQYRRASCRLCHNAKQRARDKKRKGKSPGDVAIDRESKLFNPVVTMAWK